jgi:hypothetical protein
MTYHSRTPKRLGAPFPTRHLLEIIMDVFITLFFASFIIVTIIDMYDQIKGNKK